MLVDTAGSDVVDENFGPGRSIVSCGLLPRSGADCSCIVDCCREAARKIWVLWIVAAAKAVGILTYCGLLPRSGDCIVRYCGLLPRSGVCIVRIVDCWWANYTALGVN